MTRYHRLQRGLAAWAVLVLVVAQLGALLHHAAVRHVRCAEHGELVEAPVLAKHSIEGSQLVAVEDGDADADEHCAIANGQRSDARPSITHVVLDAAPTIATPIVAAVTFHASVALYRTAPKTSPPA
ncbi:MAG: hypothetical protein ABI867_34370 [Kofleriaceae bacterium]